MAHTRHTQRLGPGDFIERGVEDAGEARNLFKRAIKEHAPIVLERLRDDVLPEYRRAYRAWVACPRHDRSPGDCPIGSMRWPEPLRAKIRQWAKTHHLTQGGEVPGWIIDELEATLWEWPEKPAWRPSWAYVGYSRTYHLPSDEQKIKFPSYQWNPQGYYNRAQVESWIRGEIKTFPQILEARLDAIEKAAQATGLVKAPRPKVQHHFAWAVRFQVLGESIPHIAESDQDAPDVRSVAIGINSVLRLVGLTRRHDRVGRPQGRKTRK